MGLLGLLTGKDTQVFKYTGVLAMFLLQSKAGTITGCVSFIHSNRSSCPVLLISSRAVILWLFYDRHFQVWHRFQVKQVTQLWHRFQVDRITEAAICESGLTQHERANTRINIHYIRISTRYPLIRNHILLSLPSSSQTAHFQICIYCVNR